jgi:hypothetical protein
MSTPLFRKTVVYPNSYRISDLPDGFAIISGSGDRCFVLLSKPLLSEDSCDMLLAKLQNLFEEYSIAWNITEDET